MNQRYRLSLACRRQRGFTLIELLVSIALVAVLATLGLSSFWTYRSSAALSISQQTLRNGRTAIEAGVNSDTLPPPVDYTQAAQGALLDAGAREYMPGMNVPKNVSLHASYDPDCDDASCQSDSLEVRHCLGKQYVTWFRTGDGFGPDVPLILPGSIPCP